MFAVFAELSGKDLPTLQPVRISGQLIIAKSMTKRRTSKACVL
jgi:hypothetical protein